MQVMGPTKRICFGIGEYMVNSSMSQLKLTQDNCFNLGFKTYITLLSHKRMVAPLTSFPHLPPSFPA